MRLDRLNSVLIVLFVALFHANGAAGEVRKFPELDKTMSQAERAAALYVAPEEFRNMSTQELFETALLFPLRFECPFDEVPGRTISILESKYPFLGELVHRADAGRVGFELLVKIVSEWPDDLDEKSFIRLDVDVGFLCQILSRESVLDNVSLEFKQTIMNFCAKNWDSFFAELSQARMGCYLLAAKILCSDEKHFFGNGEPPSDISGFANGSGRMNYDVATQLRELIKNYK